MEIETEGEAPTLEEAPQPEQDFAAPEITPTEGPVYVSTEQPKRLSDFETTDTGPAYMTTEQPKRVSLEDSDSTAMAEKAQEEGLEDESSEDEKE
jgi:hypothetical protein